MWFNKKYTSLSEHGNTERLKRVMELINFVGVKTDNDIIRSMIAFFISIYPFQH